MSAEDLKKHLRAVAHIFHVLFGAEQNYVGGMTIWIMAVLLFALFGALGYAKGAIRMIFPLVGLALGTFLAVPLGPLVKPLVPLGGIEEFRFGAFCCRGDRFFFLIAIIFIVIGFIVHWKVGLYYKYRADDYHRLALGAVETNDFGISIGLIAGSAYTHLAGTDDLHTRLPDGSSFGRRNETGLAKI